MRQMNMPKRSRIVGFVVALVALAGVAVVVYKAVTCTPPRGQAKMIEIFEADPLSDTAPADGRLVQQWSQTDWCDSGRRHGSSPLSPDFAELKRLYQTPGPYRVDELQRLFDTPAFAGGWNSTTVESRTHYARIEYKRIGCPGVSAVIVSSPDVVFLDADREPVPGIELVLEADSWCSAADK